MSEILLQVHSLIPFLFLLLILFIVIWALSAVLSGNMSKRLMSLARITLILAHIQLIFGLILLFFGQKSKAAFDIGMGEVMKNPDLRLSYVEHPTMMIIAIILITIGFSKAKRADSGKGKAKKILIFYAIALVLIASRIPYQAWLNG